MELQIHDPGQILPSQRVTTSCLSTGDRMRALVALLGVVLLVPHLSAQSSVTMCADGTRARTGDAAPCVGHGGVVVHKTPPAGGAAAGNPWLKPNPMDTFTTTLVRTQREMEAQSHDAAARRTEAAIRERDAASIAAAKAAPSAATLKKAAGTEQRAGLVPATSPGVSGSHGSSGGAKKARPRTFRCRDGTVVPFRAGHGACQGHQGVASTNS